MIVELDNQLQSIDISAGGVARIMQRVKMILTTPKGSVPMDRDFGVDVAPVDKPLPVAKAMLTSSIAKAIETYEPMVKVLAVTFDDDGQAGDGALNPIVRLKILETANVA